MQATVVARLCAFHACVPRQHRHRSLTVLDTARVNMASFGAEGQRASQGRAFPHCCMHVSYCVVGGRCTAVCAHRAVSRRRTVFRAPPAHRAWTPLRRGYSLRPQIRQGGVLRCYHVKPSSPKNPVLTTILVVRWMIRVARWALHALVYALYFIYACAS